MRYTLVNSFAFYIDVMVGSFWFCFLCGMKMTQPCCLDTVTVEKFYDIFERIHTHW